MARRRKDMMREAFEKWDEDGNGTISKQELTAVLKRLGNFKPGDVDRIMIEADRNADGVIQYGEFVDWLMKPVISLGAAALVSTCEVGLRAENSSLGIRGKLKSSGLTRWIFKETGPVPFENIYLLPKEHTIAVWMNLEAPAKSDWVQLMGDKRDGWGLSIGFDASGHFGVRDCRLGSGEDGERKIEEPMDVKVGKWALVVARGVSEAVNGVGPAGCTEFLVASDERAVRFLGSAGAVGAGVVLEEFGPLDKGDALGMSSISIWPRLLADEEIKEIFLFDAVGYGCLTEEQAAWLRLNRRDPPTRTEEEEEIFTKRLDIAADRRDADFVLDLNDLKVVDGDLPRVIEAVELAGDSIWALSLVDNYITEEGARDYIAPFVGRLIGNFRIDLHGNPDMNCYCEGSLVSALESLPAAWGVSIDVRGTGLRGEAMAKLLNQTPDAQHAVLEAAKEQKRTAAMVEKFMESQESIKDRWEEETDDPKERPTAPVEDYSERGYPDGKKQHDERQEFRWWLSQKFGELYDTPGAAAWPWHEKTALPEGCRSGQLLAHFAYLSMTSELRGPEAYGFRVCAADEAVDSSRHDVTLQSAAAKGVVTISAAVGKSFGPAALRLTLKNETDEPLRVAVPMGSVFQHGWWIHRQNLMVQRETTIRLAPGGTTVQSLSAYCMNLTCSCSEGDKLQLTAFVLENKDILRSQGRVWDYFEGIFEGTRVAGGFITKKKKKGKGKKK